MLKSINFYLRWDQNELEKAVYNVFFLQGMSGAVAFKNV